MNVLAYGFFGLFFEQFVYYFRINDGNKFVVDGFQIGEVLFGGQFKFFGFEVVFVNVEEVYVGVCFFICVFDGGGFRVGQGYGNLGWEVVCFFESQCLVIGYGFVDFFVFFIVVFLYVFFMGFNVEGIGIKIREVVVQGVDIYVDGGEDVYEGYNFEGNDYQGEDGVELVGLDGVQGKGDVFV